MNNFIKKVLPNGVWVGGIATVISVVAFFITDRFPNCISSYVIGTMSILAVLAYLVIALYQAAVLSRKKAEGDLKKDTSNMPEREEALFFMPLFVIALILSFASIYLTLGDEVKNSQEKRDSMVKGFTEKLNSLQASQAASDTAAILQLQSDIETAKTDTIKHYSTNFTSGYEAIYFSTATLFTLGYGDIQPVSKVVKWIVMAQLVCVFLLIFGVFPLLISRLSDFTAFPKQSIENYADYVSAVQQLKDNKIAVTISQDLVDKVGSNLMKARIIELATTTATPDSILEALKGEGFVIEKEVELKDFISKVLASIK
ncbi:MAG: two pore domain potassium channel family protein [Chitinophagales bacterium]|nr:two pore domain potassium channel family protein [Chitinophagales bacterium]